MTDNPRPLALTWTSELSKKKPFLEQEEKLEVKKFNLVLHYGIKPNEITPTFVKTFEKENTVKAISTDVKLHEVIME